MSAVIHLAVLVPCDIAREPSELCHLNCHAYSATPICPILQIFTRRIKKGVWDIRAIVDSGGMPSSHSALCAVS